jgi:hypothetical protein
MRPITRQEIQDARLDGNAARVERARALGSEISRKGEADLMDCYHLLQLRSDLVHAMKLIVPPAYRYWRGVLRGLGVVLVSILMAEMMGWP